MAEPSAPPLWDDDDEGGSADSDGVADNRAVAYDGNSVVVLPYRLDTSASGGGGSRPPTTGGGGGNDAVVPTYYHPIVPTARYDAIDYEKRSSAIIVGGFGTSGNAGDRGAVQPSAPPLSAAPDESSSSSALCGSCGLAVGADVSTLACSHQFHVLCLARALGSAAASGTTACPCCNTTDDSDDHALAHEDISFDDLQREQRTPDDIAALNLSWRQARRIGLARRHLDSWLGVARAASLFRGTRLAHLLDECAYSLAELVVEPHSLSAAHLRDLGVSASSLRQCGLLDRQSLLSLPFTLKDWIAALGLRRADLDALALRLTDYDALCRERKWDIFTIGSLGFSRADLARMGLELELKTSARPEQPLKLDFDRTRRYAQAAARNKR